MPDVTVLGVGGAIITLPFDSNKQAVIARLLANTINHENRSGMLTPVNGTSLTAPPLMPGQIGELVLTGTPPVVQLTAGYKAVVDTGASTTLLGDGETNLSVLASGSLAFITGGGSGTVVAGGGGSNIVASGTDWLIVTGGGDNTIQAQSGSDTIMAGPGGNLIQLGTGDDLVGVTGQDSIAAGSGADTVTVQGGASAYVLGGSGTLSFVGNRSFSTVLGGTGSVTVFGGSLGGEYRGGSDGNNYIRAVGSVTGGGSGDTLVAFGAVATELHAASGNETLQSAKSTGADTIFGGSGNDVIKTGSGPTTVVAGSGNATITLGAGSDILSFIDGQAGGDDLVKGYTGADTLHLSGYGPGEVHAAYAGATVANGAVTFTLSDNTTITIAGITAPTSVHIT